ncbi:MAG: hypothetical protein Q8S32_17420 [Burkholderiaceae bacterium]|nr:hypothetical protein [Burkholderiaceae bacterium]
MRKRGAHFKNKGRRDPGAWLQAIGMQQPLTQEQIDDLGLAVHLAIERLRTGNPIEGDWHTLAAAVNVSMVLCEKGVGAELMPDILTAQDALLRIFDRHTATGRWAFDGPAYKALTRAVEIHEAHAAAITRDGARAAMLEVRRRAARGEVLNRVPA